jgi:inositol transport system permease protein
MPTGAKSVAPDEKKVFRLRIDRQKIVPLAVIIVLVVVLSISNEEFLKLSTASILFARVAATGIVSLGAMCAVISGGIDFTAEYCLVTAAVAGGVVYANTGSMWLFMLVCIVIGLTVGLINGTVISRLKMPPFIATLAMWMCLQGAMNLINKGAVHLESPFLTWLGAGKLFNFLPIPFVVFLIMSIITYIILQKTKFGGYIYAMGGNEDTAIYAGVNVKYYKTLIYVFAGLCYGLAAIVSASKQGTVSVQLSSNTLMDAMASIIIGGTSISGGKGTVVGTIMGVLIIGLIDTSLNYLNVDSNLRDFVKGFIILAALLVNVLVNRVEKRRLKTA